MVDSSVTPPPAHDSHELWRARLEAEIAGAEARFRSNKNRWNKWYYGFLAGGIGLPALSALVLKLEKMPDAALKNDVAAVLAALGAVFTSVMAALNFRKRWSVSRTARTELQQLKVDVFKPDADLGDIATRLKSSMVKYNEGVTEE